MRMVLGGTVALALLTAQAAQAFDSAARSGADLGPTATTAQTAAAPLRMVARMYHGGQPGMSTRDSLGCRTVPLRTLAVDPTVIPRRSIVFIAETVGLPLPGGGTHDGLWYASDTGGGIKGDKLDLYTGHDRASMTPVYPLNLRRLTVEIRGRFDGCPPADAPATQARAD